MERGNRPNEKKALRKEKRRRVKGLKESEDNRPINQKGELGLGQVFIDIQQITGEKKAGTIDEIAAAKYVDQAAAVGIEAEAETARFVVKIKLKRAGMKTKIIGITAIIKKGKNTVATKTLIGVG